MNLSRPARGHTERFLRQILQERGLRPRAALGQCFLVDLNLLDLVVQHAELARPDFVLEVGSGTGSLTRRLAEQAGAVLSVEIDRGLHAIAREAVADSANVTLLCADVLRNKNRLNPDVVTAMRDLCRASRASRRKLVANLPYGVATPVISLVLLDDEPWDRFVVTVQQELADRLVAPPGTKDYGSLSVLVQALADVQPLRSLPPSVFWPRPAVHSCLVKIVPSPGKRAAVRDLTALHELVRGVMLHRRKNLRGALSSFAPHAAKPQIDRLLSDLSLDPRGRAEALPVEQFIRLAEKLPAQWRRVPK